MRRSFLAVVLATALISGGAQAAQIMLGASNIIGGTPTYGGTFASGPFNATNIVDQQTGAVTDAFGSTYWLNPDNGPANAYITIDLGAAYTLTSFDLFNTHNDPYNDRGTGDFSIVGGNAITLDGTNGYTLTGAITTLVTDTLVADAGALEAQSFTVSNLGGFRYLQFRPTSVAVVGSPCCGSNNYGLNELRAFGATPSTAPVPAPGALGLLALGVLGIAARHRRA